MSSPTCIFIIIGCISMDNSVKIVCTLLMVSDITEGGQQRESPDKMCDRISLNGAPQFNGFYNRNERGCHGKPSYSIKNSQLTFFWDSSNERWIFSTAFCRVENSFIRSGKASEAVPGLVKWLVRRGGKWTTMSSIRVQCAADPLPYVVTTSNLGNGIPTESSEAILPWILFGVATAIVVVLLVVVFASKIHKQLSCSSNNSESPSNSLLAPSTGQCDTITRRNEMSNRGRAPHGSKLKSYHTYEDVDDVGEKDTTQIPDDYITAPGMQYPAEYDNVDNGYDRTITHKNGRTPSDEQTLYESVNQNKAH